MGKIILSVAIFALLAPLGAILGWKYGTKVDYEAEEREREKKREAEEQEREEREKKKWNHLRQDVSDIKEKLDRVLSSDEFSPSNHKQRR